MAYIDNHAMSTEQDTTEALLANWQERGELFENLQISLRYYRRREWFFDKCEKLCNSLTVVGGTAVVSQVLSGWPLALGIFIALSGILPLVFGFAEQRFLFRSLAMQTCEQIGEVEVHSALADVTDEWLESVKRAYAKLQTQEPPTLAILTLMCEQDHFVSRGIHNKVKPIPFWVRVFAHFGDLKPAKDYVIE